MSSSLLPVGAGAVLLATGIHILVYLCCGDEDPDKLYDRQFRPIEVKIEQFARQRNDAKKDGTISERMSSLKAHVNDFKDVPEDLQKLLEHSGSSPITADRRINPNAFVVRC